MARRYCVDIKCAFFIDENYRTIWCEALKNGDPPMQILFYDEKDKLAYQKRCCKRYDSHKYCAYAAELMKKYE